MIRKMRGHGVKSCVHKRLIRQEKIEELVLDHTIALLRDDAVLEFIAEQTYQYYLKQNTDNSYTQSLRTAPDDVNRSMDNLIKTMETSLRQENKTKAKCF